MVVSRAMGVMLLSATLCVNPLLANPASSNPVGILTRAYLAQVNAASASAGLSVFEDETLSTAPVGKLGVRVGTITIGIDGESVARLHRIDGGAHADLAQGELAFTSPENCLVEVHAEEALLRGDKNQLTQARVKIVAPKILEVSATRGDLAFIYHDEFQVIPEGATYRIYLEAPAEPQGPAGAGADTHSDSPPRKPFRAHKVAYFVMGGVALGLTAWGLHELYGSNSGPESPAKP
jgi:hypothetical protein